MEVLRENFQKELPWIREAIYECDFVAIDAEFSGLHTTQNRRNATKTLEQSYLELRSAAMQFLTVQIGLSAFKFDASTGQYVAKPFNFYIFPTTLAGFAPPNRCFLTEASSLDFLAKNRFNFNKWIGEGIHYMTKEEENNYKAEKLRMLNNNIEEIPVDDQSRAWLEESMQRITNWLADNSGIPVIYITTTTAYQRRLVYQEVRRRWPSQLEARGKERAIAISKSSPALMEKQQKQRLADLEKDLKIAGGFRTVIDMLSESKKPIVGHNIVIDLAYILAQFVGPLPQSMDEYKQMIHATFPTVIDTKFLSTTANDLRGVVFDSSLQGLSDVVLGSDFSEPRVVLHYRHPNYHRNGHEHEAGYDAYMTGSIFIKLIAFIARKERARLLAAAKVAPPFIPASAKVEGEAKDNLSKEHSRSHTRLGSNGKAAASSQGIVNNYKSQAGSGKQTNHPVGTSVPAPLAPPTDPPVKATLPAPSQQAKLSYAAMANRAIQTPKAAATASPSPVMIHFTPDYEATVKTGMSTTSLSEAIAGIEAAVAEEEQDYDDDDAESSESDYEFVQEPAPEVHEAPFTLQHSTVTQFENFLHWGRSSHGNLCLVSR